MFYRKKATPCGNGSQCLMSLCILMGAALHGPVFLLTRRRTLTRGLGLPLNDLASAAWPARRVPVCNFIQTYLRNRVQLSKDNLNKGRKDCTAPWGLFGIDSGRIRATEWISLLRGECPWTNLNSSIDSTFSGFNILLETSLGDLPKVEGELVVPEIAPPDGQAETEQDPRPGGTDVTPGFPGMCSNGFVGRSRECVAQRRGYIYGFLAGSGFELLRISDSGVSVAGLPLKMIRFGFSPSA